MNFITNIKNMLHKKQNNDPMGLIDFYLNKSPNLDGYYFLDILDWDNKSLEKCHSYIQWLFPLSEKSQFNPQAPLFNKYHWDKFRQDEQLKLNSYYAFKRICDFYGFILKGSSNGILSISYQCFKLYDFEIGNHNALRISRILKSLRLMGHEDLSFGFFKKLAKTPLFQDSKTLKYWGEAVFNKIEL